MRSKFHRSFEGANTRTILFVRLVLKLELSMAPACFRNNLKSCSNSSRYLIWHSDQSQSRSNNSRNLIRHSYLSRSSFKKVKAPRRIKVFKHVLVPRDFSVLHWASMSRLRDEGSRVMHVKESEIDDGVRIYSLDLSVGSQVLCPDEPFCQLPRDQ